MKEKIKTQKGFIQIPLLVGIIVSIVVISVGGYVGFEYYKTSKVIKETEQLTKEEKYNEAIKKLETVQNNWFVKSLGIKKQVIVSEMEKNKKLLEDKMEYAQGIEEFNKGNWERVKELLSKVSEISPYYQDTKNKIEEIQKRITEQQIAKEVQKLAKEIKESINKSKTETENNKKLLQRNNESNGIATSEINPYLTGVMLVVCDNGSSLKEGSGFLMKIPNLGYTVVTNNHIVSGNNVCFLILKDEFGNGMGGIRLDLSEVYRWNPYTDIAVLKLISPPVSSVIKPIKDLNYHISNLRLCSSKMLIGSPVSVIGFPAFAKQESGEKYLSVRQVTTGIISGYDISTTQNLPYPNYYISAKIDSGNSGGVALSKDKGELCLLGVPTWLEIGNYATQGIVQNIQNVMYKK